MYKMDFIEFTNLKFERVEIRRPFFDPHPEKSTTNNHDWRQGLLVWFIDKDGKKFVWMPKWKEVENISTGKDVVEEVNKSILRTLNKK